MPDFGCSSCGLSLLNSGSPLPAGVFLLCVKCKSAFDELKLRDAEGEVGGEKGSKSGIIDVRQLEEAVERVCDRKLPELLAPVCEATCLEANFRRKNHKSLIITGLPESERDEDTLAFLNQSLLPALSVPSKFKVIFFHRLGQIRADKSPRLCRLIFGSKIARDIVLVRSQNLKGQAQFVNIRLRPSLTPVQQKQKQSLEDFRWGHYQKDRVGRIPVGIRYAHDGSPIFGTSSDVRRLTLF